MEERALKTDARHSAQTSMDSLLRYEALGGASAGRGGRFCRDAARLGACRVRRILGGRGGGERSLIAAREHQGRCDRERHARGSCAVSVERLCQGTQDSHLLVGRRGGITTSTSRWCWRV